MNNIHFLQLKNYNFIDLETKFLLLIGNDEGQIYLAIEIIKKMFFNIQKEAIVNINMQDIIKNKYILYNEVFLKSLFAKKKIIILNCRMDYNDFFTKNFNKILNYNNNILFILNCLDIKKNSFFFQKLKQNNTIINCYYLNLKQKIYFVSNFLNKNNIKFKNELLLKIINFMPDDLLLIKKELEKIILFLDNAELTKDKLLIFITNDKKLNIMELAKSIILNDKKSLLNQLNKIAKNKNSYIYIVRNLINSFYRIFNIIKAINNRNTIYNIIQNYNPTIFYKDKSIIIDIYQLITLEKLSNILLELIELENKCKNHPTMLFNLLLQYLIKKICY